MAGVGKRVFKSEPSKVSEGRKRERKFIHPIQKLNLIILLKKV
jgi:hypothetical protein